jgi:SAM-dependent methyltransferase
VTGGTVTDVLFERVDAAVARDVERQIAETPDLAAHYSLARGETERRQLILAYGAWFNAPGLLETTGIGAAQPPEEVHAMARGPLAAAGGVYEADMVVGALNRAGGDISTVSSALDFGCSSGRVLRVLRAAFSGTTWRGCDPNSAAIAWARANLPGIEFFVSGDAPPLGMEDGSVDLAYAISIWSHFEPNLGLRWFEEMRRLIAPGGHLVCTTHGLTSIAYYATLELRTLIQAREIVDSLYEKGWWYAPEFGEEGDWGVVNPSWGTAFLSPEWMLTQLCPDWRVVDFAPGRNQLNQDVYVLQRV